MKNKVYVIEDNNGYSWNYLKEYDNLDMALQFISIMKSKHPKTYYRVICILGVC